MARYGFDLGGTIDNNPEVAHLCRALGREGHKIIIITATAANRKAVKAKLYALNIEWYYKVVIIRKTKSRKIGRAKGEACNKWKVSVYFDNDPKVLDGFLETSKIARVLVMEPVLMGAPGVQSPQAGMKIGGLKLGKKPSGKNKKRTDLNTDEIMCPCNSVSVSPARCYHCTDFLSKARDHAVHTRKHHILELR